MHPAGMWTVALLVFLVPPGLSAQTADRPGSPSVACDADGGFVVVWHSRGRDGDGYGVFGQRFDSSGGRRGSELMVNMHTADNQGAPAVCTHADSSFVVVWQSYGQDDDGYGVFARQFDSNGQARADEFQVANTSLYSQLEPDVACGGGGFVVAWSSGNRDEQGYDIVARRFTSSGSSPGERFINTYTATSQVAPTVSIDANDGFVVAWTSYEDQDGDGYGIFAQRVGSDGSPLGGELQVNTYAESNQLAPAVASDASGGFVVAWSSSQGVDPGYDIFGQSFGSDGAPAGSEFLVNTYTTGDQGISLGVGRVVDAAGTGGDRFVIVWQSSALTAPSQDGDGFGVFAQRFAGSPPAAIGTEFRVNGGTAGDQAYPAVCGTATGSFVVVWENRAASGDAIFAQRYDSAGGPLGLMIRVNSVAPYSLCPAGDCNQTNSVTVSELVTGVNIALGRRAISTCPAFDPDFSGSVTIDELVTAVRAAVEGCPRPGSPTPDPTATPLVDESRTRGIPPGR